MVSARCPESQTHNGMSQSVGPVGPEELYHHKTPETCGKGLSVWPLIRNSVVIAKQPVNLNHGFHKSNTAERVRRPQDISAAWWK